MNKEKLGFKVKEFKNLVDWRLVDIGSDVKFVENLKCPCDGAELKTVCTFVANDGAKKMRLGVCQSCGYVGYIDKLTPEWISKFYLETWDGAEEKNIDEEVKTKQERFLAKDRRRKEHMIEFLKKFDMDKNRYVCEIGSGYGGTLKMMEKLGFKKLIGTENSEHRAEIAAKAYGLRLLTGPFEDTAVQLELKKFAPYSLIFTHHVMEHVYEPGEIIKICSGLQKKGDYLIISQPNLTGEVSLSTMIYFPHLHTLTKLSMARLLGRYGYKIVDDTLTNNRELYVVAQKTDAFVEVKGTGLDYFAYAVKKFAKSLGMGEDYKNPVRLMWSYRGIDIGGQRPYRGDGLAAKLQWKFLNSRLYKRRIKDRIIEQIGNRKYAKNHKILTAVVEDLGERHTSYEDSPIEIQFENNIKLSYK